MIKSNISIFLWFSPIVEPEVMYIFYKKMLVWVEFQVDLYYNDLY